jgi:pimeloyl-ACP methyl ester carboxylesterase
MIKTLGWIALIYVSYCLFLFLVQRHMLFPRYMIPDVDQVAYPARPDREILWIEGNFGKVEAWLLKPPYMSPSLPVPMVIFAHGNAERIEYNLEEMAPFQQWGFAVLLVEFPGYGRSKGSPSQANITTAFVAAYDQISKRADVDADKIILYGRSIGGGAICSLLNQRPAAAVILFSTFTSVRAFAPRYLVPPFLVRDPFDNLAVLKNYTGPLLLIHGKLDEVIPYSHSVKLRDTAPKARLISYDCGHNDCPPDWRAFWQEIESFLRQANIR